jgi:hypothetical protein
MFPALAGEPGLENKMRNRTVASTISQLIVVLGILGTQLPVFGQQAKEAVNIWLHPQEGLSAQASYMISILGRDGAVIKQSEGINAALVGFGNIKVGTYDVRVEGEGVTTVLKRGIAVLPDETTALHAQLLTGQGVHVVEYAGAISGEDLLARLTNLLTKLDKAAAELTKK